MKTLITLITFILAVHLVAAAPDPGKGTNCKSVRTGKFKLVDKEHSSLIERTLNTQTETDLTTNEKATFRVKWVSSCEYELTIVSGREQLMNFFRNKTLVITILETYEKGYKYEAKLKGIAGGAVVHTVEKII